VDANTATAIRSIIMAVIFGFGAILVAFSYQISPGFEGSGCCVSIDVSQI
jgi:hypothetical protein